MIEIGDLEADLNEACNLKCAQCSHSSPHNTSSNESYSLNTFYYDLDILTKHVHSKVFRVVGGEPLLNKNLHLYLQKIKESGISEKISLFTNGLNIKKTNPEVFKLLDEVRVSVYNLPKIKLDIIKENIEYLKQFKNLDVEYNHIKTFLAFNIVEKNKNPNLIKQIYDSCYHKRDSYSIFNGKVYRCFAARKKYDFLEKSKVTEDFQYLKNNVNDSITIDDSMTEDKIRLFLFNETPLDACAWCLGCSGKKIKNYQISSDSPEYRATLKDLNFNEGKTYVSNCLLSWHRNRMDQLKDDTFYFYSSLKEYKNQHATNFVI